MPNLGPFEQRHPDLLAFEADFRPGNRPRVAFARKRHFHIVLPVLEHAQGDGLALSPEVQKEVVARNLDRGLRYLARVHDNVIREEIGQGDKATGALHSQPARAGARLGLERNFAFLHAEFRRNLGLFRGLIGDIQGCAPLPVLDETDVVEAGGRIAVGC